MEHSWVNSALSVQNWDNWSIPTTSQYPVQTGCWSPTPTIIGSKSSMLMDEYYLRSEKKGQKMDSLSSRGRWTCFFKLYYPEISFTNEGIEENIRIKAIKPKWSDKGLISTIKLSSDRDLYVRKKTTLHVFCCCYFFQSERNRILKSLYQS